MLRNINEQKPKESLSDKTLFSLTHPQKRIWYIEKLYPKTPLYNIGGPSKINGFVDFELFSKAINVFIKKNDSLRLQLVENNDGVFQYLTEFKEQKIDRFDFSEQKNPEKEFEEWAEALMRKPFIMENSPLYYFALFKIDESSYGVFVKFHHIISDGWSIEVASRNIPELYMKLLNKEDIYDEVEYSYTEFIESEQKYLQSDRFIKNRSFWNEKYSTLPENLDSNSSEDIEGRRVVYNVNNELSDRIRKFTTQNKCSLNTFFVAAYLCYVYKTTYVEDIIIGTPVLNRSGKREKSIFGMFTSAMPCRIKLDPEDTVEKLFEKINEELRECYFNQKYPYDLLVQDINLKKQGYDSLFQVCVNYYNTKLFKEVDGQVVENIEMYNGNQLYSLQLIIKDWADKGNITLTFDYKVKDYTERQIESILRGIFYLSEQILEGQRQSIGSLEVLAENEKNRQIYELNSTEVCYPCDKTIYQLFEAQVDRTPDKIALCHGGEKITYHELNIRANQLAKLLRSKGIGRNTIVGLVFTHSIEVVISILGILKAGGAYLPIDPEYPSDRIEYMLKDSGTKLLLTNCSINLNNTMSYSGEIIRYESLEISHQNGANLESINKPQDLVYVIYTSGSTGRPKGVMIEHMGLVNYIWWAKQMYIKSKNDAFALYSSLAFDLTVTSIFTPLINGNSIYIYSDDGQEYVLYKILKEKKVSIIKLTPAHLSLLKDMDNKNSSIKRFIVGGEDLKLTLAMQVHKSFCGDIEIYNEYGPTETVVGCMIYKYNFETDAGISVPIGVPADNVQIYILDKNLKPVPEGNIGELFISGDGVSRGYINQKELTEERFINNPYIQGKIMYKTGDLAKFLNNGVIEYAGRADQQVKIRGYRVELGEIEKQILSFGYIINAVVVDKQDHSGNKYLCAYITSSQEISINELRNYLLERLPGYMVPLYFVNLEEIPLTKSGKVDIKLLPVPDQIKDNTEAYIPPRSEREEKLIEALRAVLNTTNIGMRDNFYYHGGDSIKAIQIAGKLNELGYKTKVRDILSHPIFEEMSACLEYSDEGIDNTPCTGSFKPSPVIAWFLSQNFADVNYYNQSVLLDFTEAITKLELGLILDKLVGYHDSLRLNYDRNNGELFYNEKYLTEANTVCFYDLSKYKGSDQEKELVRLSEEIKASLNIEDGILIKACIFELENDKRKILLTAHHIVIDGVSWRILLEDFAYLYEQKRSTGHGVLPQKTHSFIKWANELENYALVQTSKEIDFWKETNEYDFQFPIDYDSKFNLVESCTTFTEFLEVKETEELLFTSSRAFSTKVDELLITALALSICEITKQNKILIELEGHGREELFEDIDVSRTVGWFTSIYPVVLWCSGRELAEIIKEIKDQLRKIPSKGLGFGIQKYYGRTLESRSQKNIRFNYLGDLDGMSQNSFFNISELDSGKDCSSYNHTTALIDINAMVLNKRLRVSMTYSKNQFYNKTIEDLSSRFLKYLKEIIRLCSSRKNKEYTTSDFEMVTLLEDDLENLLKEFE